MVKMEAVMIGSENPAKLAQFYEQIFGKPMWEGGEFIGFDSGGGTGLMVGPHDQVRGKNHEPGRVIYNLGADDVQAEFDRLKGLGAEVIQEPYHPGEASEMWLATLADPDGNYFQLATPMDQMKMES